ncbi:MAG TPA: heavy-metal-associated domain-containing protein [Gemmataceae bacterium]|nr:heavy-metal-associated domain-containing protein [Gemmataceae bacterium]
MRKSMVFGLAVVIVAGVVLSNAVGQQPAKTTVISIPDLDCPVCAKNVEKAITALADVEEVKTDVDKNIATVTPKANKTLSPKALWEAVEKAGFDVKKLEGPSGTFTKLPPS